MRRRRTRARRARIVKKRITGSYSRFNFRAIYAGRRKSLDTLTQGRTRRHAVNSSPLKSNPKNQDNPVIVGRANPHPALRHKCLRAPLQRRGTSTPLPRVRAFDGATDIFITPGYGFKVADVLLTNFHLPKSTLFMLVCAFAGTDEMRAAYAHAVLEKYRFFSYGDCCLLFKKENDVS